jgi:cytochrome c oxidase assembly protein subunit 15
MGCPDWPKCFGGWAPPTRVEQLPTDYKEKFAQYRDKKNQKFARFLTSIGMGTTAKQLLSDPAVLVEQDFNAQKTWTEYINRVAGVIVGLMFITLVVLSLGLRKTDVWVYRGAMAALVVVIIQGWFGSIVVSTNLTTWTITVHMLLAFVVVALLVWLLHRTGAGLGPDIRPTRKLLMAGMAAILIQTLLGTQVREVIDTLATTLDRKDWIANAGTEFIVHRTFSWVVFIIMVRLWLKWREMTVEKTLYLVPFLLILCSLLTGVGMAYFGVPALLQPVHLALAVISFGWFFQAYLVANKNGVEGVK